MFSLCLVALETDRPRNDLRCASPDLCSNRARAADELEARAPLVTADMRRPFIACSSLVFYWEDAEKASTTGRHRSTTSASLETLT